MGKHWGVGQSGESVFTGGLNGGRECRCACECGRGHGRGRWGQLPPGRQCPGCAPSLGGVGSVPVRPVVGLRDLSKQFWPGARLLVPRKSPLGRPPVLGPRRPRLFGGGATALCWMHRCESQACSQVDTRPASDGL